MGKTLEGICMCGKKIIPAVELRPGYVIHWKHKVDGNWCIEEQ